MLQPLEEDFFQLEQDLLYLEKTWTKLAPRLRTLDSLVAAPDFWDNQQVAAQVMKEKNMIEERLKTLSHYKFQLDLCREMLEAGEDTHLFLHELRESLQRRKLTTLFKEVDQSDCLLEVQPGAGGEDARNWALMLFRMYSRYAQKAGYGLEVLEEEMDAIGMERGVLRISATSAAAFPYGYLKHESGAHRLVRLSPFNANKKRHTSFAGVDVFPVADRSIEVEVDEKDVEKSFTRSPGAGGQSVNTTDSCVRLLHKPSGIVVKCHRERSQYRNLEQAMSMLRARLYKREVEKQEKSEQQRRDGMGGIDWGNQVRSYILHPYQLVKDSRTEHEEHDPKSVLGGDIQVFLDKLVLKKSCGS